MLGATCVHVPSCNCFGCNHLKQDHPPYSRVWQALTLSADHLEEVYLLLLRHLGEVFAGDGGFADVLLLAEDANLPADGFSCELVVARDHHHLQIRNHG